jgi:hypothetical protein
MHNKKPLLFIQDISNYHKASDFLQDLTQGSFEENLKSLKLQEGIDYIHFS